MLYPVSLKMLLQYHLDNLYFFVSNFNLSKKSFYIVTFPRIPTVFFPCIFMVTDPIYCLTIYNISFSYSILNNFCIIFITLSFLPINLFIVELICKDLLSSTNQISLYGFFLRISSISSSFLF